MGREFELLLQLDLVGVFSAHFRCLYFVFVFYVVRLMSKMTDTGLRISKNCNIRIYK